MRKRIQQFLHNLLALAPLLALSACSGSGQGRHDIEPNGTVNARAIQAPQLQRYGRKAQRPGGGVSPLKPPEAEEHNGVAEGENRLDNVFLIPKTAVDRVKHGEDNVQHKHKKQYAQPASQRPGPSAEPLAELTPLLGLARGVHGPALPVAAAVEHAAAAAFNAALPAAEQHRAVKAPAASAEPAVLPLTGGAAFAAVSFGHNFTSNPRSIAALA